MSTRPEFERLRVVLVATRNPLNIGAAARAMSNFGFLRLRVVNPYEAAFREARSAVGASALLASAEKYNTVAEAVAVGDANDVCFIDGREEAAGDGDAIGGAGVERLAEFLAGEAVGRAAGIGDAEADGALPAIYVLNIDAHD